MIPHFKSNPDIEPSYAERLVIKELKKRKITYFREVEFQGCRNPSTGAKMRYDFYLPKYKLIIEFDGKAYHESVDALLRDDYKNEFAKRNKIRLTRLSGIQFIASYFKTHFGETAEDIGESKRTPVKGLENQRIELNEKRGNKKPAPMTTWQKNHQPKH